MRYILPFIILAIVILIDFYIYHAFRVHIERRQVFKVGYIASTALFFIGLVIVILRFGGGSINANLPANIIIGLAFSVLATKLFATELFLIEDAVRLVKKLVGSYSAYPSRSKFIFYANSFITICIFLFFLYGITIGKYHYKVRTIVIQSARIPEAFNNYKIVHISDIHCGTFDSKTQVMKGIHKINELNADAVVFTGDLVNAISLEAEAYIDVFNKIESKDGIYSILGNHDYAHYSRLSVDEATQDVENLKRIHEQMNFKLLLNEGTFLRSGEDSIALLGVENWGLPPFPQYGSLDKASANVQDSTFTILLSHDPSHWDAKIKDYTKTIDLTLSGHTHGMQFGIYLPWLKLSPVWFKYKKWGGLYSEGSKHLYVNIGFGFIGLPGRVGMRPEITEIILKSSR